MTNPVYPIYPTIENNSIENLIKNPDFSGGTLNISNTTIIGVPISFSTNIINSASGSALTINGVNSSVNINVSGNVGGNINMNAGNNTAGNGGDININSGNGSVDGGSITLQTGAGSNADIIINSNNLIDMNATDNISLTSSLSTVDIISTTDDVNIVAGANIDLSPAGLISLNAGMKLSTRTATPPDTLTSGDSLIFLSGAGQITLPAISAANIGQLYIFYKFGVDVVDIVGTGADTVDGAAQITLNTDKAYLWLISDGISDWKIIGN